MSAIKTPFQKTFVVDDNEIDRYIITSIIERFKFSAEAIEFDMARKALDYLRENKNNISALPEVILLDINMPEMTGFDFLDAFAQFDDELKRHISIFILSSSNNPDDFYRAADNPYVSAYHNKPLNEEKLKLIINRVKQVQSKAA